MARIVLGYKQKEADDLFLGRVFEFDELASWRAGELDIHPGIYH
jgi:hypothetical protein